MLDFRQYKGWGDYLKMRGWLTDTVKSFDGKGKLQVLIFKLGWWPWTLLKLQRNELDPDFNDLKRLKKKYRVLQTVIEPLKIQNVEDYKKAGFKRSRLPFLATKTVVIDLRKDEKQLWKNLSENAKRLIKANKEVENEEMGPDEFHEIWRKNSKVWVLTLTELKNLIKSFGKNGRLSVARDDRGVHSGLLSLQTKDTLNYFQTWTSDLGRKSGAHYKLVWEEILRAKAGGVTYFDFEGIYDEEFPIKKWKGFTEFKKKFGGEIVHHPGSFSKWL